MNLGKAYQQLVELKTKYKGARSLLFTVVRRVEKTWLVREFGK